MSSNRDIWVNRCRVKISSRFSLAQAAVLRWEQLLRGARPRITTENPKWMETPLREIATEAVAFDPEEFAVKLEGTPYEPPRPEPEDDLDELLDIDVKLADAELDAEETPAVETPAKAGAAETAAASATLEDGVAEPEQPRADADGGADGVADAAADSAADAEGSGDGESKKAEGAGDAA